MSPRRERERQQAVDALRQQVLSAIRCAQVDCAAEYLRMRLTQQHELASLTRNCRRLCAGNTMRRKLRRAARRGLL